MNVLSTEVNFRYHSYEIYLSGCNQRCPGCHNTETWSFHVGIDYGSWISTIFKLQSLPVSLIKNIWILGGEPLDQDKECLQDLLSVLKHHYPNLQYWLWTSYELDTINTNILQQFHYVKTGKYMCQLPKKEITVGSYTFQLASSNQNLIQL